MNRLCPTCEADLLEVDETVPFEENDQLFTVHYCSEDCREGDDGGD